MTTSIARWAAQRRTGTTQQFIAFQLCREWFALPIQLAHRVVPLGPTYGDPADQGIGLTHYQNQEILVLDIQRRIFGQRSLLLPSATPEPVFPAVSASDAPPSTSDSALVQAEPSTAAPAQPLPHLLPHLLIVHSRSGELVGLRLETLPTLRRLTRATIAPLPSAYLNAGCIRCVSALVVPRRGEAPLFLLNLDELLHPLISPSVSPSVSSSASPPVAPALPAATDVGATPDPQNLL